MADPTFDEPVISAKYIRRHLQVGWWSLFGFTALGLLLESLHGFKVPAYVDVSNETRRLMWTLAHAHGTLMGILNILFAVNLRQLPQFGERHRLVLSRTLLAASVLLPTGFVLGGLGTYAGDPGPAALIVPIGGVVLLLALWFLARAAGELPLGGPSAIRRGKK